MRAFSIALLIGTASLGGCSNSSQLLGSYIDTDYSDGVMMVQIDSVDKRTVHGTVSLASFQNNGVVQSTRVPISGTIDDKALNLSIENGTSNSMLNGTIVPDGLDLTMLSNGHAVRYLFKRKDAAEFNKEVASLRSRTAQTQQEIQTAALKAQAGAQTLQLQREIDGQVERLIADATEFSGAVRRADSSAAVYQSLAARDGQLRTFAARIGSNDTWGRAAAAEGQISGNQATALGTHTRALDYWQSAQSQSDTDIGRANQLITECQTNTQLICNRLGNAIAELRNSVAALRSAIGRETATYDGQQSRI